MPNDSPPEGWKSPLVFWFGTVPGRTLALISCIVLFLMMMLTLIDVGGRYLFNSPLPAATEIISLMMPAVVFCALPFVGYTEGHVTIDLLDGFVPKGLKRIQGTFVNLVAAGGMIFVCWRLVEKSIEQFDTFASTDDLFIDLWPFAAVMSVLAVIAAIAMIAAAIGYATGARTDPALAQGRAT